MWNINNEYIRVNLISDSSPWTFEYDKFWKSQEERDNFVEYLKVLQKLNPIFDEYNIWQCKLIVDEIKR